MRLLALSLPLAVCLVALTAPAALPCGGLFCAAPPPEPVPPEPVDQSAERIIFEVDAAAGEVTAHVQISYAGSADDFAWIVPVPSVPQVEESEDAYFADLDAGSRPAVMLPASEPCPQRAFADDTVACGGCSDSDAAGSTSLNDRGGPDPNDPVQVYVQDYTENFEFVVLGAERTSDLVNWLGTNGYNVSSNMTPVMDVYNAPGAQGRFLALKLRDGKQARDIVPIAMTYQASAPMIPIQLTAVAAQPLMGIQVFIVGDSFFLPDNYAVGRVTGDDLLFDGDGSTNYFEWAARRATEANGRHWVHEYAGPAPSASFAAGRLMSRFYTRMSPERMTLDPTFRAAAGGEVDAFATALDFTARTTLWSCGAVIDERLPSPCAFNYCGKGAGCAVVDGAASCVCPNGQLAQFISGPDGSDRVTCVPEANPYGITGAAGGEGGPFDPCADYACGDAGSCVLRSGFPSCRCDVGAFARLQDDGRVQCQVPGGPVHLEGPGAGAESAGADIPQPRTRFAVPWLIPLLAAGLVFALRRRRRRHGQ